MSEQLTLWERAGINPNNYIVRKMNKSLEEAMSLYSLAIFYNQEAEFQTYVNKTLIELEAKMLKQAEKRFHITEKGQWIPLAEYSQLKFDFPTVEDV